MNQVNKKHSSVYLSSVSVAPMLDWTTRHCRYFHRLISPNTLLYTEMISTGAIIHGHRERFLRYNEEEHPVAIQLGGSNPQDMATCANLIYEHGYDEVNINCGCPSDRVQKGQFGAVLMENPDTVSRCVEAMKNTAPDLPVTIKCRIGIDEQDSLEFLDKFITQTKQAGCNHYILHARKCWLKGLSPKENRTVPTINYDRAIKIKEMHPELTIAINGEIKTTEQTQKHLENFDSAMIGREAYQNPYILNDIENYIFGTPEEKLLSRTEVALAMIPYIEKQMADGAPINTVTRHMMGLFQGQRGAKKWRQTLSTLPHEEGVSARQVIEEALKLTRTVALFP